MFEVTVEAGFSSGHYLRNYRGKCENPHGHNYKVRVTLAGAALDAAGLLLDFKLLKQVMRPVIERKNAGAAFAAEEAGAGIDCVGMEIIGAAVSELEVGVRS
jgi:6-pyruvoyl tetrahydropterin synthase/QueD family protein